VAVLFVALAVVMALGIMGVLKTVSASSDNTDNRNNRDDKGRTILSALVKTREIGVVALNPQGPSHGDMASSTPRPTTKAKQRGSGASTCSAS
jgi:hypothetical protein